MSLKCIVSIYASQCALSLKSNFIVMVLLVPIICSVFSVVVVQNTDLLSCGVSKY